MAIPPVGGLLILLFFVSIKHFPELDLSGSIALLWAVAVVGGFIVLGVGLGAMLPSLMELACERPEAARDRHAFQQLWCALPGWVILLLFLLQTSGWAHSSVMDWSTDRVTFLLVCMSVIVGGVMARRTPASGISSRSTKPTTGWLHGAATGLYLAWACWVWAATLGFATIFLLLIGNSEAISPVRLVSAAMAWLVFVMGMNALAIRTGTTRAFLRGVAVAIVAFLGLLLMLGNLSGLAVGVLRTLQQTDLPVRLIVTEEGCELANKAVRNRIVCKLQNGEKLAIVCPVILQSRIGSPFLVEFAPLASDGHWPAKEGRQPVPIPRDMVRSWPRLDLNQASTAGLVDSRATAPTVLSWIAASNSTEQVWLERVCGTP